ncbi:MAG: DUF4190 domain-containing protein [Oscillospiraceae bacterium]
MDEQNNNQQNPYSQPTNTAEPAYYQQPQQPQQAYYYQEPQAAKTGKKGGLAIASMITGICSMVLSVVFYFSLPCAIVAIILAIVNLVSKGDKKGMAIAGLICGGLGLIFTFLLIVLAVGMIASGGLADYMEYSQYMN